MLIGRIELEFLAVRKKNNIIALVLVKVNVVLPLFPKRFKSSLLRSLTVPLVFDILSNV